MVNIKINIDGIGYYVFLSPSAFIADKNLPVTALNVKYDVIIKQKNNCKS